GECSCVLHNARGRGVQPVDVSLRAEPRPLPARKLAIARDVALNCLVERRAAIERVERLAVAGRAERGQGSVEKCAQARGLVEERSKAVACEPFLQLGADGRVATGFAERHSARNRAQVQPGPADEQRDTAACGYLLERVDRCALVIGGGEWFVGVDEIQPVM